MDSEQRVVRPRTHQMTCPGQLMCFFIITFYFSLLITIFRYYMTMTTKISNIGGCGQRTMSGTTQDMSFDMYWAIGMFLLSLLFIFHY